VAKVELLRSPNGHSGHSGHSKPPPILRARCLEISAVAPSCRGRGDTSGALVEGRALARGRPRVGGTAEKGAGVRPVHPGGIGTLPRTRSEAFAAFARELAGALLVARRRVMRSIRKTDTSPEMAVCRIIYRLGFRYRLHGEIDYPLALASTRQAMMLPSRCTGCFRSQNCVWWRFPRRTSLCAKVSKARIAGSSGRSG
jgi:DNA mismatch endonuclease Vsr